MVLPCIAGIANSVLGRIVDRIESEVSHLVKYSSNVEELRSAVKDLSDGVKSIEEQIAEADNRGESKVDSVVKGWQEKAASLEREATGIIRDEDRSASPTCLLGLRLNLWACYLASKKSIAAKDEAVKLREEAKTFVRVATIDYSNTCSIIPTPDFDAFNSREIVSNNILAALKNPNVHMVGVHGMGGLGKTTLVQKVSKQLHEDGTFKHVVMAYVSQKPDVIKIQQQIADQLRIKLDATTDMERARQLMEKLEKREKLLIVLDDIWEILEFNLIGIPFRNQLKDTNLKILMTSRNESLLRNGMGSTCNFELQVLSPNDAWNLFQNTCRITTPGIPEDCLSIASEVVERCSGLPVLLVIVAKALRTGDLSIWRDALRQLESFEFDDSDEVYKKIELSYNFLKSNEMKSLFRFFGQLDPHFTRFSDLLKYTTGLSLFKGCMRLEQVRDRLHKCLNDLKAYGLLQDVEDPEEPGLRMHDVVHKFAVFVGGRDHHMLTFPKGVKLEEWPDEDDLEAIALPHCHLPQKLAAFHAPKLVSFVMHRMEDDHPIAIPDKFFVGMKRLKLMDLTTMSLSPVLPSSLTALVRLQTLCLYYCELDDIAIIGELPRLQVLCLRGSSILRLPNEIGNLDQLKLLDLNHCSKLKEIASEQVLSRLTSLEELCMENSFKYWEKEGYSSSSIKNASLGELKNMPNLKSLDIHIPHAEMFPKDYLLAFEKLERFRILIGEVLGWSGHDFRNSRTLKLKVNESLNHLGYGGIKALMGRAEDVYLQQLNGFESLCELDSQGFPHMKHLNIQNGVQTQYIVNSNSSCVVFPKLESLVLQNLTTLRNIICRATASEESWFSCFQNLQSLILDGCEKITYLFVSSMVKSLAQLKRLEVSDCESMKEIVFTGGTSEGIISGEVTSFLNLNIIQLKSLPNLIGFCNTSNLIEFPSLAHLSMQDCPELRTFTGSMEANGAFFDEKVAFPNLEELKLSKMDGLKMIWGDALHPTSFSKLKKLAIEKGSALLGVFSSGMMIRALNLESLIISQCESLIEVFDVKTLMRENKLHSEVQETQLKTLHISKLPKLKHLWNEDPHGLVSFQNLKTVTIHECPSVTSLFRISVALDLHQLEELEIACCEGIEEIVSNKEDILPPKFVFPNVTTFRIFRLPELKKFYPGPHTSEWPILNSLHIQHCDKINLLGTKFQRIQGEVCKDEEQLHTQVNQQPFLCLTKMMQNLEEVTLRGMDVKIYDNDTFFLADKVKVMCLSSFDDDFQFFPLELLQRFQNLNRVDVSFSAFKLLFPYEILADEANVKTLARISHLVIWFLNEMTHIWDGEFNGLDRILQNLEELEVDYCENLINLAPSNALFPNLIYLSVTKCKQLVQLFTSSSTVKSLANLTGMKISECDSLAEIVASDHGGEATSNMKDTLVFPKLKRLILQFLPSLTSFCSTAECNFAFPSLYQIIVAECPEMKQFCQGSLSTPMLIRLWVKPINGTNNESHWEGDLNSTVRQTYVETVISHQRLTLSSDPVLQDIWDNELPAELFSALRFLEVVECLFVTYAISSSLLRSLNNLEELRVTNNKSLEEVFDGPLELKVLSELRKFYLAGLPSLMHVCPENLEGVLDFRNLTMIDICNCSSLRYVFTASMALCLIHIQVIQVKSCAGMEAIILNKENDDNIPMILPQLTALLLESLPCLSRFYAGNGVLESPNLKEITIIDCPKMETFTSPAREVTTNGENQETIGNKALFNDKVVFPNLEELQITKMSGLKMIWGDALHPTSFFKLKTLRIEKGSALLTVFSSGMVTRDLNLESLIITECESLIEVFDVKTLMSETKMQGEVQETQLNTLHLSDLPKLKRVWNEDPDGLVSFQKLESVSVKECPSLTSLFPISVALGLHQLKELIINECEGMTEIVSNKEDSVPPKFLFPNVTCLKLRESPELKSFYPGSHTSEWPILNDLVIYHCDKIDLFGTKFESIQSEVCKDEEQLHTQVNQQPFLCFTKIMPNLEEVSLRGMDMEMIYDNASFFMADKVQLINLTCFHDDSQVFPVELLQRFQNLNKVDVSCSAFKLLFPSKLLSEEANVKTLPRIPRLSIRMLNELTHIWDGEFDGLDRILQNLEELKVQDCENLINLAPSNALFPNLTCLVVIGCKQVVQLMTSSSTVKSLANLTEMKISGCDSLTEIVGSDHADEDTGSIKDTVVFPKLERLTVQFLANLASFCSAADCNFVFPCLDTIIVAECPKIMFFCQGALSTPILSRLWVKPEDEDEDELHWEGDLNSTVRQLYIETEEEARREETAEAI